jgi:hypothetical protein
MATYVTIGAPFLFLGAASCDHELRLSGPAPSSPPAGYTTGTERWDGPYGPTVDEWTDVTHPPGGSLSYSAPTTPNSSWLIGSQLPAGWYTVIRRDTRRT